jgi:signal transduction histidine kinase
LFFGGPSGLSVFDPGKLADNPTPPPVVLTDFELFNKPARIGVKDSPLQQAINVSSTLTLRYWQSVLRFEFAALDFTAPEKNRYAYKLEPFDLDWQYTGAARRLATYTNLDPGDYTFRLKASNNDGIWNEQGVTLHIRVLPPWWNTLWFRALCAAAMVALLCAVYKLRLRQLAAQFNMRLEERVKERTRIARELHDTLLQSFQASLIRMQAARNLFARRPEDAMQSLDRAITMSDGAVAEGRSAIQNLREEPAAKGDLAKLLTAAGQEFAPTGETPRMPIFCVKVEGERQELDPVLQDEVYRIARELLRNAFQHAQAGRIEAELRFESRQFRVHVRDDGIGIDPEILTAGRAGHWGLAGMRERANQLGGKFDLWSQPGAGTEAVLTVPAAAAYGASNGGRFSFLRRKKAGA